MRAARAADKWQKDMEDWAEGRVEIKLGRSHEYASSIVRGLMFGETFKFNATVPNEGIIPNLPHRCAVKSGDRGQVGVPGDPRGRPTAASCWL